MALDLQAAKERIDGLLSEYRRLSTEPSTSLLPAALTTGKVYEAWVLCMVLERLHMEEGYLVVLKRSSKIALKSSPGPINRHYPYFELTRSGSELELWTDVEFRAMSSGWPRAPLDASGHHELDLIVVPPLTQGRPRHQDVLLGVECKNTAYSKALFREILGVRRELSLLRGPLPTAFDRWPRAQVPADPPSCLLVYSTDPAVQTFQAAAGFFGIDMYFEPLS